MTQALLALLLIFATMALLSRAAEPSQVLEQQHRAEIAEAQTTALQTEVARLRPTAAPCRKAPYFTSC